jgi:hypothetical protein
MEQAFPTSLVYIGEVLCQCQMKSDTHDCASNEVLVKSSSMVKFTSDRYMTEALVTSHELAVLVMIKRCTCNLGMAVAQIVWYDI